MATHRSRCRSTYLPLVALLVSTLPAPAATDEGRCSRGWSQWNPSAPARFGLAISLSKADRADSTGCGLITQEALQVYVAAQWVCRLLNGDGANESYVPGVQFGECLVVYIFLNLFAMPCCLYFLNVFFMSFCLYFRSLFAMSCCLYFRYLVLCLFACCLYFLNLFHCLFAISCCLCFSIFSPWRKHSRQQNAKV